jgi:hypothetical protein
MILFKNNITRLSLHPKHKISNTRVDIKLKRVGFKYGFIPVYEKKPAVYSWGEFLYFVDDFNEPNQYIEDGKVYMVPHIDIYMNDGYCESVYFKTIEEMNNYANEIKKDNPHIEV